MGLDRITFDELCEYIIEGAINEARVIKNAMNIMTADLPEVWNEYAKHINDPCLTNKQKQAAIGSINNEDNLDN